MSREQFYSAIDESDRRSSSESGDNVGDICPAVGDPGIHVLLDTEDNIPDSHLSDQNLDATLLPPLPSTQGDFHPISLSTPNPEGHGHTWPGYTWGYHPLITVRWYWHDFDNNWQSIPNSIAGCTVPTSTPNASPSKQLYDSPLGTWG